MEATLAISMSVFSVVFVLQTLATLVGQWDRTDTAIGLALVVLVYGWTGVAALAAVLRVFTRSAFLGVAVVYLVAEALWPLGVPELGTTQMPWLLLLAPMPGGFLIIASRGWRVPLAYAILACGAAGVLRLRPSGGGVQPAQAALDGLYGLFLDVALLALIVALRQAARSVDAAQRAALERYATARTGEAMEHERVQIDALVHDRVLTTFLTAARAEEAKETRLATSMAEDAIRQLTGGAPVPSAGRRPVGIDEVIGWLRRDSAAVADAFAWTCTGSGGGAVPAAAAEALVSAAVQAMVNSVNHAGGPEVPRSVEVRMGRGSLTVTVADEGRGFAMSETTQRIGVRVSILERVRTVGGTARIRSAPGRGARIELGWREQTAESLVREPTRDLEALVP